MRFAPWAAEDRPLDNDDFVAGTTRSVIEPISRFAIDNGVGTGMAPTHYLGDGEDPVVSGRSRVLRSASPRT